VSTQTAVAPPPAQDPRISPEMYAALANMRRSAVAAVNTYRSLLHDQAARMGADAEWLDGLIAHGARAEFLRRLAPPSEAPPNG
jgi:hypothetical protein